jgi:hypothetical protein
MPELLSEIRISRMRYTIAYHFITPFILSTTFIIIITAAIIFPGLFECPCDLRHKLSLATVTLESLVRIPLEERMSVYAYSLFQLPCT